MATKHRRTIFDRGPSHYEIFDGSGNSIYSVKGEYTFWGDQEIKSDGHRWPPRRGDTRLDIGGSFGSRRTYGGQQGTFIKVASGPPGVFPRREYTGMFYPMFYSSPWWIVDNGYINPPTASSMIVDGTTHIARADPTRTQSSMAVAVGETLRDGLPFTRTLGRRLQTWQDVSESLLGLWHRARASPPRLASELFLEYQFGFAPLIRDIRDFFRVSNTIDQRILQLRRDNDRVVRRQYHQTPDVQDINHGDQYPSYGAPPLDYYLYASPGTLNTATKYTTTKWFSGAFTYHIPFNDNGSVGQHIAQGRALSRILFGVDINISTVYELTPWSWALDWVSNVGDGLSNIVSAQNNGLVMKYGYEMQSLTADTIYTLRDVEFAWPPGKRTIGQTLRMETKNRVRATPFGFGLQVELFTPRQWALIGALGISRRPQSLEF